MMLLVGLIFMWQARPALLYHVPIYFKGPSWMHPWQAIVGGSLCSALAYSSSSMQFTGGKSREATAKWLFLPLHLTNRSSQPLAGA
jgi:hypothetical protein